MNSANNIMQLTLICLLAQLGGLSVLSEYSGCHNTRCAALHTQCTYSGHTKLCQESGIVAMRKHAGRARAAGTDQDQCRLGLLPDTATLHIPQSFGAGSTCCTPK